MTARALPSVVPTEGHEAAVVGWRPMETLPHPQDAGLFWGALRTGGINSPLQWEVHILALDDETHEICPNFYQGWNRDDYEVWQPCAMPAPPQGDSQQAAFSPDTQGGIANGDAAALASLIQSEFIGVAPDDQGAVLEDHDWRLIVSALARLSVAGAPDRPRR